MRLNYKQDVSLHEGHWHNTYKNNRHLFCIVICDSVEDLPQLWLR